MADFSCCGRGLRTALTYGVASLLASCAQDDPETLSSELGSTVTASFQHGVAPTSGYVG